MRYETPASLQGTVRLLSEETGIARILAGGTDVLVQLNTGLVEPDLVVDIKRLPGMADITAENGGYRIGAAVSCAQMNEHGGLCTMWPGVVEAANLIGSTQIQSRATIVGNLCNASPAADSVPALVAAGATAAIVGPAGRREMDVADIPVGPGETVLEKAEIVESIFLPARQARSGDAYQRFIPRTEMDIAVVSVGINLTVDDSGTCTAARVAVGAVAETVLLIPAAAAILIGSTSESVPMDDLAHAVSDACRPIDDKRGTAAFRTKVAGVLAQRVATLAFERAGSSR